MAQDMREALIETLNNLLSSTVEIRTEAEKHIKAFEVNEEFGIHLAEVTLNSSESFQIRQLSSVLLKQYVEAHWTENSDKFRIPVCSQEAKNKIKEILPHGLYEPINKVRSCVAYAISAIANSDWPEQWPNLFGFLMTALKSDHEAGVDGAMSVLIEFSRDLTDQHIPQVAPIILPEMYKIYCDNSTYNLNIRVQAVEIFSTIANMICLMSEYNKNYSQTLLQPILPTFLQALVKGLQEDSAGSVSLKKEILNALTVLLRNVPKQISDFLSDILVPVWRTLTDCVPYYFHAYQNNDANHSYNEDDDNESDCSGLILSVFEFVGVLVENSKHKKIIEQGLTDLIYYLIVYMQVTDEQVEDWLENSNSFVEDEDEGSYAYSVRISARDLIQVLSDEVTGSFGASLVAAVVRHVERCQSERACHNGSWWKGHEAIMLTMGTMSNLVIKDVTNRKLDLDIGHFVDSVVLASLDPNFVPLLSGRALWCGSRYCRVLNGDQLHKFLEATVSALSQNHQPMLKIFAVRSIWGFCEYLKISEQEHFIKPFLPSILDGLMNMATQTWSETLSLTLETMSMVASVDVATTQHNLPKILSLILAIFEKANNDPALVELVQDLVSELSALPHCAIDVQNKFVPHLTSVLSSHPEKVGTSMHSVAMGMLETMIRASQPPLCDALMNDAFDAVVRCTLSSDDITTLQNGGECLRAYVSISPQQVATKRDSDGVTGLECVIQVTSHLLSPTAPENTASFVGKLINAIVRNFSPHDLGNTLEKLLRAVLSKLQSSESLSVVQSLVLVYAHLIQNQLHAVIDFLGGVPGPTGQSALHFVLTHWCSKQHLFYGNYERKVTCVALSKILEHGISTNDVRFNSILVQGDQIMDMSCNKIRTRSKGSVERWTEVQVLVKIFKLIVYELSNAIDANLGKDEHESSGDESCEDEWKYLGDDQDPGDTVNQDVDPDAVNDPIYELNLQQYLTDYIVTLSQHHSYAAFLPHLNQHEKQLLKSIGVHC